MRKIWEALFRTFQGSKCVEVKVKWVLVAQLCLTLWPNGWYLARLLCPWDSLGKNTGVGSHSLLQGIFPTQGLNPGLLHCRQILYHLRHQRSPSVLNLETILSVGHQAGDRHLNQAEGGEMIVGEAESICCGNSKLFRKAVVWWECMSAQRQEVRMES